MNFLRDASILTVKRFPGRSPTVDQVCTFPHPSFQMAKYVAKYSIMTQEMVDSFCEAFYIPNGVHPMAQGRDKTIIQFLADIGLLDFIQTADPRKVRAVEVQKRADQVTLLESTKDFFVPLVIPAAGGSSSAAAVEVPVPTEERQEDVAPEDAYLNLADPNEDAIAVRQGEERVLSEQPKKVKRRRLVKQSDALPAKKLRTDHPSLASDTGGKTLANLEQIMPEGSHLLARKQPVILATAESSGTLSAPVDTAAATTSTRPATASKAATDVGPSHHEELESSDDSFYEIPNVDPAMAKRCCLEFNMGEARKICLRSEVRSRTEHELELKEKLRAKYVVRGKLLEERDLEILDLKSKLAEKETEAAEAIRLRDQVSSLSGEKFALTAEVSVLKVTIAQKDHDISLLDSHATSLPSGLENAKVACTEAGDKIISLTSERNRLISERSLSVVDAYNPEAAKANYIDAVKALEGVDFPLVNLLKSKKDAGMDEVMDCFLLDGPAADLPKAMHIQPRAEGAKEHVAALRKLMIDIVSNPLSSQTWVGEASTSAAPLSAEDYQEKDTDEALGSVVVIPQLEAPYL
ncbi:hypothetical protein Tco_1370776 [Tanacetum coccineum]